MSQSLEVQEKKELVSKGETTVPARYYVPSTDIYETDDALKLVMEVPGVERKDVEELRDVVQLSVYEGLSHAEVATLLSASPDAVAKRWQRLCERLRGEPRWAAAVSMIQVRPALASKRNRSTSCVVPGLATPLSITNEIAGIECHKSRRIPTSSTRGRARRAICTIPAQCLAGC